MTPIPWLGRGLQVSTHMGFLSEASLTTQKEVSFPSQFLRVPSCFSWWQTCDHMIVSCLLISHLSPSCTLTLCRRGLVFLRHMAGHADHVPGHTEAASEPGLGVEWVWVVTVEGNQQGPGMAFPIWKLKLEGLTSTFIYNYLIMHNIDKMYV